MLQSVVVGLIVLAAVLYAFWALLPAGPRLNLARMLGEWGRAPGRSALFCRAAGAVERAAMKRKGMCSDCGAVEPRTSSVGRRPKG